MLLLKLFSLIPHKNKLKGHERVCNDHDYCNAEMPNEYNKILKIQPWRKVIKSSIYDLC